MHFYLLATFADTLANGGWIFLTIGFIASFAFALHDHHELVEKIKSLTGRKKSWAISKLILLWSLPILTGIGAVSSQLGADKAETKIKTQETEIAGLSNRLDQTGDSVFKLNPINRPISEISAIVSFRVKEDKPSEIPNWGMPRVALIMLCESNWCTNTNIPGFHSGGILASLEADKFDRYFDGKTLEYILHFHLGGVGQLLMIKHGNTRSIEWGLEHVNFMDIETKFLPHDAEILGGSGVLTINSSHQKWFDILPQKDLDPDSGKSGFGYQVVASASVSTNSQKTK